MLFLITQIFTYWLCICIRRDFISFSLSVSSLLGAGNTLVCQFYRYDSPGGDAFRRKINIYSQFPNFSNAKSDTDCISYPSGVEVIFLVIACDFMFLRVCSKGMIMPSFPLSSCLNISVFSFLNDILHLKNRKKKYFLLIL